MAEIKGQGAAGLVGREQRCVVFSLLLGKHGQLTQGGGVCCKYLI